MTKADWLPFSYRTFYDVPRMILLEDDDRVFLLDCPFDETADEYQSAYCVYLMDRPLTELVNEHSWESLAKRGRLIGKINVDEVTFDDTRRHLLRRDILDLLTR